jgi:hypothetical protein
VRGSKVIQQGQVFKLRAKGVDGEPLSSQVVLFGGEGATDPQIYAEIVGCSADEVFERQRALEEARPVPVRT